MTQNLRLYLYRRISGLCPDSTRIGRLRIWLLRWCGIEIGEDVEVSPSIVIRGNGHLKIGSHVKIAPEVVIECWSGGKIDIEDDAYIAEGAYLSSSGFLRIGKFSQVCNRTLVQAVSGCVDIGHHVMIAHGCNIKTTTHEIDMDGECIAGRIRFSDIVIGDGSWLCAGSIIIPGVKIGKRNVIAAGAVVTKSTPDGVLMAGVPAVVKKRYIDM